MDLILANDKYRATTRATWIASPADSTIQVTAIPANLPTQIVVGWDTEFETVFRVEGTSGTNASNYALTGLTKVKGYTGNLPEGLAVNCLNNEEFFNQYGDLIADMQESVDAIEFNTLTVASVTTSVAIDSDAVAMYVITAQAGAVLFSNPTGTPSEGKKLIIRIKDNGTARAITWGNQFRAMGVDLPSTTVLSKTLYLGFFWNATDSKWDLIAQAQQA